MSATITGTVNGTPELPRLRRAGKSWQLLVDGKPFLILGGELQNSSMSSAHYMDTAWQNIAKMGVNTILGTVSWEDIEPEEGQFVFTEFDGALPAAREHGFRMILVWFGSFKNGMSRYTPSWVKTNPQRFPRMQHRDSNGSIQVSNIISIFHDECVQADAKAFASLMQHLSETDAAKTVIMVQVENEVGLLGDSRDRSKRANQLFSSPVPMELVRFLEQGGDSLRPELKSYLAGVASYLKGTAGGGKPGEYPSGGAVIWVLDIWQRFTPTLHFISPDIYTADYSKTCSDYCHRDQPLFVPEQHRNDFGARRIWEAIGLSEIFEAKNPRKASTKKVIVDLDEIGQVVNIQEVKKDQGALNLCLFNR
ncbi:hypothetical protein G7Z17_g6322 [Cylindrodendrum hubeiense]|uniref:Glycoside hydrolase family 42 N-terminal domain-containing protein n=1 Tax=Cylindrodendrum hubeiense TaxID=595255 RepID=A0A9P5LGG4_9HYPO|nr:hypothetical protein G7Z17_g6322 [Cylindrodendrum hubeiense]